MTATPKILENLSTIAKVMASRECMIALRDKPFTIMSDCLIRVIKQELTATARELYLYLYGHAEKNFNACGKLIPIIISTRALADNHIFKSERTVRRRLAELETKGFIIRKARFNKEGDRDSNAIWPIIPERFKVELSVTKVRNNVKQQVVLNIVKASSNNNNDSVQNASLDKGKPNKNNILNKKEGNEQIARSSDINLPSSLTKVIPTQKQENVSSGTQLIYERYNKEVTELRAGGVSVAKANMRVYQKLEGEEKRLLTKYLEEKEQGLSSTKLRDNSHLLATDKNGIYKIYNIFVNNNRAPIVDKFWDSPTTQSIAKTTVVKFKNNLKKLSKDFIFKELIKFCSSNPIPPSVFSNGKTITDLIAEIEFHVANRSLEKTTSELHALNGAKQMLRQGTWRTPKKYIHLKNKESIKREQLWLQEKRKEARELKGFINNCKQEYLS